MPPRRPSGNPNSGRNFYAVLGVERGASDDEIKRGYRKMAVKWHPDKWSGKPEEERKQAEEKFKEAAEAYEILSDKQKKEVYDRFGEDGLRQGGGAGPSSSSGIVPMGAFPGGGVFMSSGGPGVRVSFSVGGSGLGGSAGMSSLRAEELFAALFSGMFDDDDDFSFMRGRPGPRAPPPRPPPLRADLLPRETVVKLVGLSNAALNDSIGAIVGFDEEKRRYTVRLKEGGNEVAARPLNVRQVIADARVDLPTARQLGFPGMVSGSAVYDTQSGKYTVTDLPSGDHLAIRVKPENLLLPDGTRVTAVDLTGRPELNGQAGRVVGSDGERYVVEMAATGEQVKLKFGNVVALHGYNKYMGQFG